ncbi:MAG: MBL fold metallo-hydrolase [Solirubrobacterales bacterium]
MGAGRDPERDRVETAPGCTDVVRVIADNPGPMTLEGTNTYLVGGEPCLVVDPGPEEPGHLGRVRREGERRGGIGGIFLTHSHLDHSEAVGSLQAPLLWGSAEAIDEGTQLAEALGPSGIEPVARTRVAEAEPIGALTALPTPGHATEHACFLYGDVAFCGDLLLGYGSTIVPPRAAGGSLADYMASLDRLEATGCRLLCPGHGPWIERPFARIAEQRAHRLEREQALRAALGEGIADREELLARVWADVPTVLLPAASLSLQAHLEKLAADGLDLAGLEAD